MKKIILSSLMLITTSAFAHTLPVNTSWSSDYAPGKGVYELNVISNNQVQLLEDKNTCGFTQLGKYSFCTRMGFFPIEGFLNVLQIRAPRTTLIYSLENSEYRILHSTVDEANGYIRLQKVNNMGVVIDSIRLFRYQ